MSEPFDDVEDNDDDTNEDDDYNRRSGADDDVGATAQAVLEHIVKSVVDDPTAVQIDLDDESSNRVILEVRVGDGDMGRVIGRRGRVANAIRTVVRAAASRDDISVDVEFAD